MNTGNAQTKKKYTHEELHELGIAHEHSHEHSHDHPHDHDGEHSHEHGHGEHGHHHVHSEKEKKAVVNRLAKAIGHLEAVKRMVERDADCSEVLIQLAAVRSAINNTGKVVLKNHMNYCIVEAVKEHDMEAIEQLNKAIDQFMK
ncbi:MAG: metal-sensing transcriptional repressor [Lachnospiraceae bacterium]|nr:metal-sensing transcriptional repressor [Lachnospiraceae bacterium]